jgi:hypothetical protein
VSELRLTLTDNVSLQKRIE